MGGGGLQAELPESYRPVFMLNDAANSAIYPSLKGRVVLITGGASGIGEAIVEAFARQNAKVAFLDLQKDAAEALIRRISEQRLQAPVFFQCDLTDIDALRVAVSRVVEALGDIDVLVNNAGNDTRHSVEDVTPELWDKLIGINLKQQFFTAQSVIPDMRHLGHGSIINLSSIAWAIPVHQRPGVRHCESRHRRHDSHPGARARAAQHSRQLRDARLHLDRAPAPPLVHR